MASTWTAMLAAGVGSCLAAGTAAAGDARQVSIAHPFVRAAVVETIHGVAERLHQGSCDAVFEDFHDAAGRTLLERLATERRTATDTLDSLSFVNGDEQPLCRTRSEVGAFTQPGGHVVQICATRFLQIFRRDRRAAETLLIHELLHTIGLGENPPSSAAITEQVMMRCR